ncbi:hypothetical protein [Nocardia sp. NPDC059229]|uniref:hypothetical protein n=1 Tax=Nocardia sp. NPDC059229 TaxID=3346778 RepID=UPI0036BAD9D0
MLATALAATDNGNGFDWATFVGLPAAVLAGFGIVGVIVSLVVGVIHPIAVQKPVYWIDGDSTRMRVVIKNCSFRSDRNVEGIVVYEVPSLLKRAFTRKYRTQWKSVPFVPWGNLPTPEVPVKLSKREVRSLDFELRTAVGNAHPVIDKRFRIEAKSGTQYSRARKIKHL